MLPDQAEFKPATSWSQVRQTSTWATTASHFIASPCKIKLVAILKEVLFIWAQMFKANDVVS